MQYRSTLRGQNRYTKKYIYIKKTKLWHGRRRAGQLVTVHNNMYIKMKSCWSVSRMARRIWLIYCFNRNVPNVVLTETEIGRAARKILKCRKNLMAIPT